MEVLGRIHCLVQLSLTSHINHFMDFISWFPAATTTGSFAVALWLGRELISTRLTKSIQHDFDKKIESVRAELRANEERFKAQLREKEAEIAALRSGALTVLASRQAALDRRRMEAVDQLWASFIALGPARTIAANLSIIKFEYAAEQAERDPKVREVFELIGQGFDIKSLDQVEAARARPFLSPMVWAVYSAIRAILYHSAIRFHALKSGFGTTEFVDHKAIEKLIVAVLPHYTDYLQKTGPSAYYYALDALDEKLLAELQSMLSGAETDKASLQQASEIIRQANALQATDRQFEATA